jgi:Low-density lipoprotein receptor domain class A
MLDPMLDPTNSGMTCVYKVRCKTSADRSERLCAHLSKSKVYFTFRLFTAESHITRLKWTTEGYVYVLALFLDCSSRYQCNGGICISKQLVCDGQFNCPDLGDERGCSCNASNMFRCANGLCVRHCNHVNECGDNSDETGCGKSHQ